MRVADHFASLIPLDAIWLIWEIASAHPQSKVANGWFENCDVDGSRDRYV